MLPRPGFHFSIFNCEEARKAEAKQRIRERKSGKEGKKEKKDEKEGKKSARRERKKT